MFDDILSAFPFVSTVLIWKGSKQYYPNDELDPVNYINGTRPHLHD